MAISLNTGIEGISFRGYGVEQKGDFPLQKVYLPLSASIPSYLNDVLDINASDRMLAGAIAPKISNRAVVTPSAYSRLFEEIESLSARHMPANSHDQQIVHAAGALFSSMRGDFEVFSLGRNALIRG